MIVISCWNPELPRSTTDEELLTTMLASVITWRASNRWLRINAKNEISKAYHEAQEKNSDQIIALVFPLLGLTFGEVYDMVRQEEEKCRIRTSGSPL